MEIKRGWKAVLITVTFALILVGCGGSNSTTASGGGGDSGSSSSETVTITGTLSAGTISGNLSFKAGEAASGYSVVAVNNESNATYRATTAADGSFSLDVPSGSSYVVSLINNGSYVGPMVFDGSGSEVNTAVNPSADEDMGEITVDAASGYARVAEAPDSVNSDVTAVAVGGVPVGAGNDGKTEQSGITNRADSDKDMDGVPNIFDADEDNDGVRNGVASTPSGATVVSDYIETVMMSSNIWADHNTSESAANLIALRLHVIPVEGQEDQIASVECIDVPSSIADVATVRWADSLGAPVDYPDENSLWSDSSYGLYKTTTLSNEQWIISIKPGAIMSVGDTFTIRVTYTDASYEDFFVATSYVLTDWAKIVSYNGSEMPEDEGVNNNPIEFDSDELVIVFSKPLDEDGEILEGLSYSLTYGESDCTGGTCAVPTSTSTPEEAPTDNGDGTFTSTVSTTSSATYYVTPVAESSDGQRNGEETWFTRQ